MSEHHHNIKAADLVTPQSGAEEIVVDSLLIPVEGTQVKVFALWSIKQQTAAFSESLGRIMRTHLTHAAAAIRDDAHIARRFETMLADMNAALGELAALSPDARIEHLDAVVGVLTTNQLFVSGIGELLALFLHKTAERRFVIYELHAQFKGDADATWEKPFVTVLDGEVHPGDIFYVATRPPAHAISIAELQDILVTLPPASALQRIRQFLPHGFAYGGLCFCASEEAQGGPPKKTNPIASLTQLGDIKHETADLLGEQGTNITGFLRRGINALSAKLASPGSRGYKAMLKRIARVIVQILGLLLVGVTQTIRVLVRMTTTLVARIFDASKRGEQPRAAVSRRLAQFRNLPPSAKYVAGSVVAVLILLIFSVTYMTHANGKRKAEDAFATTASRVEEKTSGAEASLIYNDTDKARALLAEAAALLETLPSDNKNHEERIAALTAALDTVQSKIRKVTPVELSTVAELGAGEAGLATFTRVAQTLYAFALDAELFRINELERTIVKESSSNGTLSSIRTATEEGANMLFVDGSKRLGRVDTTAKTMRPIASGVEGMASAEDIVVYNGALYVLSAASQQIVKMRPQGDGYEAGTTWIAARSSDLTGARAIAIDGNVYVLTATDVVLYKSGREVPWDHDVVEPALSNPVDIWTSLESTYLYILDAGEGRVVVHDKESGDIVTQYAADGMKGAIGFAVDETGKSIVIALSNKVVSFSATHLLQ